MGLVKIDDIALIQLSDIDSNIYLMGDTVIDSGTGFNFIRLNSILNMLKTDLEKIRQVINTHCHFDHIGGNGYFYNAKILIHEKDASIIETGDPEKSNAGFFDGKLKPRKVDKKLKEGDVLDNGLKVIHTPGHTPGSICLYDQKRKILFSGDTLFSDGVGRTDLPGGDPQVLTKSLERLSKLKIEKILPGHGEPVLKMGNERVNFILKQGLKVDRKKETDC